MQSLFTEVSGQGKTVVLLPGMLATTAFYRPLAKILSLKHQVVSMDLLGFGRSEAPKESDYSLNEHLESINKTLEVLQIDKPFTLVGHSMGALLALSYAARFPQSVSKLILLNPPVFFSKEEAKENITNHSALPKILLYGQIAKLACLIFCNLLRPLTTVGVTYFLKDLPREVAADTLLHNYNSYSKTLENVIENQDIIKDLKKLKILTLIVYGDQDKRVNIQNIQRLVQFNNRVKIIALKDLGHQLPLFQPDLVANLIN